MGPIALPLGLEVALLVISGDLAGPEQPRSSHGKSERIVEAASDELDRRVGVGDAGQLLETTAIPPLTTNCCARSDYSPRMSLAAGMPSPRPQTRHLSPSILTRTRINTSVL